MKESIKSNEAEDIPNALETEDKIKIRPNIQSIGFVEKKNPEEKFQNTILRPIIKMQHELLVAFFENHLGKNKVRFDQLNNDGKREFISKIFRNDNLFKTSLKGLILGHFTLSEYKTYLMMSGELNKRIFSMIKERLCSVFLVMPH